MPSTRDLVLQISLPTESEQEYDSIAMQQWHSSKLLSQLILSIPELVRDKTVIELGSGYHGSVVLAASYAGAKSALATDSEEKAVGLCRENLAANQPHCAGAAHIDWSRLESCSLGQFDVVLGADLVYMKRMCKPLAAAIQYFLKPGGLVLLVCPNSLARDGIEELGPQLNAIGSLCCTVVPVSEPFARAGNQYDCYIVRCHAWGDFSLEEMD